MAVGGAQALLLIGVLLLAGVAAEALSRWVHVPRVTLLVLLGVVVGPGVLEVLPPAQEQLFRIASTIALVMVGFLVARAPETSNPPDAHATTGGSLVPLRSALRT